MIVSTGATFISGKGGKEEAVTRAVDVYGDQCATHERVMLPVIGSGDSFH